MNASTAILVVSCVLVTALWLAANYVAARREFPGDPARARGWTLRALLLLAVFSGVHSILAYKGVLSDFSRLPPPFFFFFVSIIAMSAYVGYSGFGRLLAKHLSFAALIGYQSFRILAELVIYSAYLEGIAPRQMSLKGYNPDMIPAVLAISLYFILPRRPSRALIHAWNALGFASLLVITFIAITSMPLPIRLFMQEPSNIWVTTFPYVLLPSILVTAALAGHFVVWRKLAMAKGEGR